jgi:hypothetical protein
MTHLDQNHLSHAVTLLRFNDLAVRGFLHVPASVASANLVHPTIQEEGTIALDAAAHFMQMASAASKLNVGDWTNIVIAREISRVKMYPQYPSCLPSTLSSQNYRDYRSHALEVIRVRCFLTTALQLVALQQAQSAAFKYSGA